MWRCSNFIAAFALWLLLAAVGVAQAAELPYSGRVLLTPDQRYGVSWQNQELVLWSRKTRKPLKTLRFDEPVYQVELSYNGRFLVAGFNDGVYRRWKFPALQPAGVLRLSKQDSVQWPFALSPDGVYLTRTVFAQTRLQDVMRLEVWDWRRGRQVGRLWAHQQPLKLPGHYPGSQLAFHPLGGYLSFATEGGQLKVYNTLQHRWVYQMPGSPPMSYARAGDYFAFAVPQAQNTNIRQLKLWHLPTNLLKTFAVEAMSATESALVLSDSGRFLAYTERSNGRQRKLVVRRVTDGKVLLSQQVAEEVDALSITPEENAVLTSSLLRPEYRPVFYAFPHD